MKSQIILLSLLFTVGTILAGHQLVQSRFWDSSRVEKSVHSEIKVGHTEKSVVSWLTRSGIPQRRLSNTGSGFARQIVVKESGLNPKTLGSLIVGSTREGFVPDDLYNIDIYFFFDKNGRLKKYDFYKVWRGL